MIPLGEFVDMLDNQAGPCYIRQAPTTKFEGINKYFDFNDFVDVQRQRHSAHL